MAKYITTLVRQTRKYIDINYGTNIFIYNYKGITIYYGKYILIYYVTDELKRISIPLVSFNTFNLSISNVEQTYKDYLQLIRSK